MNDSSFSFENLAKKESFNASVRHIQGTLGVLDAAGSKANVIDTINEMLADKEIKQEQTSAIIRLALVEKLGYSSVSHNFAAPVADLEPVFDELSKWNAVDLAFVYYHPDVGVLAVNPKNLAHLSQIDGLRKNEFGVLYAGFLGKKGSEKLQKLALDTAIRLLEGDKVTVSKELYKGEFTYKQAKKKAAEKPAPAHKAASSAKKAVKPAKGAKAAATQAPEAPVAVPQVVLAKPQAVEQKGPRRMTPQYSVPVTNELFHNGNVEAWKRIVQSYTTKYPNLEVYIYYDGERIININSLFKWGKVKHGSTIQFAVAGDDIKDVAKLQRYLMQGASHGFEAFLHGAVGSVLNLF
jgi:hypothetical protein